LYWIRDKLSVLIFIKANGFKSIFEWSKVLNPSYPRTNAV
jgi:hypothetical protein